MPDPVADPPPAGAAPVARIVGAAATTPASAPTPPPDPAAARAAVPARPATTTTDVLKDALKPVVALLANVTVLTALLVYFGWRRAETHADRLGIDESILGMTTREYVLRSVGPVLVLLVGIAVCGLAWVALERRLTPRLIPPADSAADGDEAVPVTIRLAKTALTLAWIVLPMLVYLLGFAFPAAAFVLFPASIGAGALLWVYAGRVRRERDVSHDDTHEDDADHSDDRRSRFALVFVGLLVLVCLFWTASNYAEVLGDRLADDFAGEVDRLPGIVVSSERALFLEGPGVDEQRLPGPDADGALRYRYEGLRLLEHTGGKFFLLSDGWTTEYGVVFVLRDDDQSVRFDFVRDRR
jgi:hypothetical protein